MTDTFVRMIKDDEGATLVEYGLIISLIAVVCIATLGALGTQVNAMFGKINTALGG